MQVGFDIFPGGYFRADPSQFAIDRVYLAEIMQKHGTDDPVQAMLGEIAAESQTVEFWRHPMMAMMEKAAKDLNCMRIEGCA